MSPAPPVSDPGGVAASSPACGPTLFARFAYPPNEKGYCGSDDHRSLLEYGASGEVDQGVAQLARAFSGAWPYLALIAEATGIGDPLDRRVVEAYWVGNSLLDRIPMASFGHSLEERFRRHVGSSWSQLTETIPAGGIPHHSFQVFCVYPWVGMLDDSTRAGDALSVLDRCRIRWGQVVSVCGEEVVVASQPLVWEAGALGYGPPQVETVTRSLDGLGFVSEPEPGQWLALHWGWVCDRLTARQQANLMAYTARVLDMTNHRLAHPGPAAVLS